MYCYVLVMSRHGVFTTYELIVSVLMLNVLIAVVGDSYEYSVVRARCTFIEMRIELIVELEVFGIAKHTHPLNACIRETNQGMHRWLRRFLCVDEDRKRGRGKRGHEEEIEEKNKLVLRQYGLGASGEDGVLSLLQSMFRVGEETISLRDLSDSWLGCALDMERRTRKIVAMAESNIEDTVETRVDMLKREIDLTDERLAKIDDKLTLLLQAEGVPSPVAARKSPSRSGD